jgi:hypothetical protein
MSYPLFWCTSTPEPGDNDNEQPQEQPAALFGLMTFGNDAIFNDPAPVPAPAQTAEPEPENEKE